MSAKYDFYKTPDPKGNKKHTRYHARVVPNGTISTEDLAKKIHARCTVTTADVNAVLISLSEVIIEELRRGSRVYIKGLGYLQVTLQCPSIQSTNEIRAESIRFKSIAFRPEVEMKEELSKMTFERTRQKIHSAELSAEHIDQLLTDYFEENEHLTRSDFQRICGMTRTTANRRLQALLAEGKILNISRHNSPLYRPAEGCYEPIRHE